MSQRRTWAVLIQHTRPLSTRVIGVLLRFQIWLKIACQTVVPNRLKRHDRTSAIRDFESARDEPLDLPFKRQPLLCVLQDRLSCGKKISPRLTATG